MTVKELRALLAKLPESTEVLVVTRKKSTFSAQTLIIDKAYFSIDGKQLFLDVYDETFWIPKGAL
jgi:ATP/maltotriose-dependent transcriptional regulator MalT